MINMKKGVFITSRLDLGKKIWHQVEEISNL